MKIMKDEWFPFVTKRSRRSTAGTRSITATRRIGGRVPGRRRGRGAATRSRAAARCGRNSLRLPHRRLSAGAGRTALVGHVRARAALSQQLRRPAESLRAAERGLLVRDVRGSHQGHELLHGGGLNFAHAERRHDRSRRRPTPTASRIIGKTLGTRAAIKTRRHDRDPDGRGRGREESGQRRA